MKPAAFTYLRPVSIDDALRQLAELGPQAKVIAGGQSLGPMMNMRLARPAQLIDLNDLTELAYVREAGDWIRVGALTRHYQIAESALVRRHCPLLSQAAQTIGHYAIRQRGTIGGSLAHADPAAQLPLIAVTLGARFNLMRRASRRQVDAGDFFVSAMTTSLAPDELIESIDFPKALAGEAASFRMFNRRHGDYAIVAVAATVTSQGGQGQVAAAGVGRRRAGAAAFAGAGAIVLRPHTRRRMDCPGGRRGPGRGDGRGRQPRAGALSPRTDTDAGRRCARSRIGPVAGIANPWKSRASPSP